MKIRRYNGSSWVQEYPEVGVSAIVATGTPSSTTFLRGDGAWAVPTAADGNNYLTGVSGSGDGTVTFTRSGLSNLTWNAAHSHSEYLTSNADDTMTGDLLLSNAALSYQGQNGVAVPVPQGGLFATTSSTQTGYLKITLPVSWTSTMLSFFVDIYEYTADESFTLQLAGYNYSSSSQWINTTANLVSSSTNRVFNVRFGHDGSKCAIYIGESNSTWSYMQVRVRDFLGGYSNANPSNWADGWEVGFTTTLGTITSTQSLESEVTNADTADKLTTARTITLGGDLTGNVSFDGSANVTLSAAVANDSHTHDGRYYTETESNANFLKRTSTSLLDVNAANGTQLYTGSTGQWTNRGPAGNNAGALLSLNTHSGNYYSQLWFDTANDQFYFRSANGGTGVNSSWQKVWHSGNDGTSSGLAADTLDGQHGSYYAPKASPALTGTPTAPTAAANTNTTQIATTAYVQGEITDLINGANASFDTLKEIQDAMATDTELSNAINNLTIGNGTQTITAGDDLTGGGVFYANQVGNTSVTLNVTTGWWNAIPRIGSDGVMEVGKYIDFHTSSTDTSDYNPRLTAVNSSTLQLNGHKMWHAGNDGSGSGLDADTLDTKHASDFYLASNPNGYTSNAGDITSVTAGTGLSGGGTSGAVTLNLDLSEFTDMTADVNGLQDEMILLDNGAERRKLLSEIKLSQFNNDAGWAAGDITNLTAGGGLTGGGSSGSVTISHADTSSQASLTALTGANVISDIDVDTYGHITSMATRALTPANIGAASSSHNHSAGEIVTGNFNTARLGTGTATSGYVLKSDGDGTASWQQDNNTTYTLGSFGVTATAAELNKMDGVTATTAELNKMDGVTATTTELNYTDGVTSNIQTQLNGKLSTTGTAAQAAAITYVTSCPTANNTTGMKVYVGSTDCSTKYSGWLYLVT